jgi:putative addiction module component (TIGR02574 family)
MEISADVVNHVFSLPAKARFELAQRLMDSISPAEAAELDQQFIAELQRREAEMLRGEETVEDWRQALSDIEESLSAESRD